MMLDESIYDLDDIDRAAERGAADYIKLKLMKAGGLSRLAAGLQHRSEEHTSELQSLMRISYAVFCLKKKKIKIKPHPETAVIIKKHNRKHRIEQLATHNYQSKTLN